MSADLLGPINGGQQRGPDETGSPPTSNLYDLWQKRIAAKKRVGPRQLVLPSGLPVIAKRPHLMFLLQQGRIPDALTPQVHGLIDQIQGDHDKARETLNAEIEKDPEGFVARWIQLCNVVWMEAVIDPPFARGHDDLPDGTSIPRAIPPGHLNLDEVEVPDKEFLFIWCQGVDHSVQEFLDGKAREIEAMGTLGGRDRSGAAPSDLPGSGPDQGIVAGVADLPSYENVGPVVLSEEERDDVGSGGQAAEQEQRPSPAILRQGAQRDAGDRGGDAGLPAVRRARRAASGRTARGDADR